MTTCDVAAATATRLHHPHKVMLHAPGYYALNKASYQAAGYGKLAAMSGTQLEILTRSQQVVHKHVC